MSGMYRYVFNNSADDNDRQKVTWALVRRVLTYARPYVGKIAAMLALILVSTGLGLISPLIIRQLIDRTLPNQNLSQLNMLALALLIIPIFSALLRIVQRWLNASVGEGVIYDLRVALYKHMQRMSLRFFTNTRTGELMSRLNNDVVNAQDAISNTTVDIITNALTVAATLGVMLYLEWRLTIIGLLVLPGFIYAAQRVGKRLRALVREAMEYNADMNARMNETLNVSGVLLVKLFGRRGDEVSQFGKDAAEVRDIGIQRAIVGTQLFAFIAQIGAIGTAIVFWIGGYMVINDDLEIGTVVAFGTYLAQLYGPLQALATAPVAFVTSIVSFERVFEVIDLPLDIEEKENAVKIEDARGAIVFENVTFNYAAITGGLLSDVERVGAAGEHTKSGRKPKSSNDEDKQEDDSEDSVKHQARETALTDISFKIEPGELVALVGPSGAGKTTMTYLIPRLYDPTEGRITLDGHDLRDLQLDALAENIGMVTQETYLFNDTILNNLLYAKPDATTEEVHEAAKAANIHDFIMGLDEGYDTIAGERGYRLSGGEKQRIAIARVILKDPRILVLDEATSHLDSESEALIQDALSRVMVNRTSIVIAHRLSTVRSADEILVMDRGQIVERGTHDDLLAEGGLYAELHDTQFGEKKPDGDSALEPAPGD
ncbi:MAG: ABC transporter ATP-binding protein [Chloroflexota bacterium]